MEEEERRKKHQTHVRPAPSIQFIREGAKLPSSKNTVQTSLRPDIVIWSEDEKRIILMELMALWEDGCKEALERKATKYQCLVQQCRNLGRLAEVGCWGFPA